MKKLWLVASSDLNNEQQDCQIVMISESFQTNLDPDYRIQKKTKGILYTQVLLNSVHLLALVEFVAEVYGQGYIHFLAVCRCCFLQDHPKNSDKKPVKFIYSEKATKFCEISPLLLSVCNVDKRRGRFRIILWPSQNI